MSLSQLTAWCDDRFGRHMPGVDAEPRRYDIPWIVMDNTNAANDFGWRIEMPLPAILENIAQHAYEHQDWLEWWLLTIITLLAATLDIFRLGVQPVWYDEVLSVASSGLSSHNFLVHVINYEPFMVLYYVLLRLWLGFGQSEFAVRSL
jgi:hypothetical protein